MIQYIIKRILYFIPTLILITLVIFFLSKSTPGDPLGDFAQIQGENQYGQNDGIEREYCRKYKALSLDKPAFFFSIRPSSLSPEIRKICSYQKRKWYKSLCLQHGDYSDVKSYSDSLDSFLNVVASIPDSISTKKTLKRKLNVLYLESNVRNIEKLQDELIDLLASRDDLELQHLQFEKLSTTFEKLNKESSPNRKWIPSFEWNGFDNQYFRWVSKLISLDLGESRVDGQKVFGKIWRSFKWTGLMVLMSFILTLLIGIPLGVLLASKRDSKFDKLVSLVLYLFYSIPIFWLATILIVFFTTNEYGSWTNIFPSILPMNYSQSDPFITKFLISFKFLILPVICIAIHSIAYISRLTRSSVVDQLGLLYIQTAISKGISAKAIMWKHSFRNALIPIASLLIAAIPASIAGSLVIEVIFNIPGMGRLIYESVFSNDWPVLFGAVILIGLFTVIIYLIGDIVYRYINPKISFER